MKSRIRNQLNNSFNSLNNKRNTSTSRTFDDMAFADLYTRPTESESYEDPEDGSTSTGGDSEGLGLQIPSGYLSPSSKRGSPLSNKGRTVSSSPTKMTGIKDEDRLLMLAKHPNATEEQVIQTLVRQQQAKEARQQQKEQQQLQKAQDQPLPRQQHQVTFSPAFPVDADTGEAWDRQPKAQRWSGSSAGTSMTSRASSTISAPRPTDTSFDRAWASHSEVEELAPPKQSILLKFWRRVFPYPLGTSVQDRDDSVVSKQDASMSISMASDKTPKISNVDEKARAKRIRQQAGYLSWGDRWEQFRYKMLRTRQSLLVLGLLLILIVAIVVTIITALASQSDDKPVSSSQGGQNPPLPVGGTLIPRPDGDNFMTNIPTFSPTAALVPDVSTPPSPSQSGGQTSTPTGRPITSTPTATPTSRPTLRPTTPAPTVPDATRSPTRRPTPSPTRTPTFRPTAQPTARPTLRPVAPPTATPAALTQPPTALNFLESPPLAAVGASLAGNQPDQRFGQAVALSDDGRVIAVGAPSTTIDNLDQAGMVQVFAWIDENGGSWQPRGFPLVGRNEGDQFGSAVALSADGSILVVSEPMHDGPAGDRSGNVRAFVYSGNTNGPSGGEYRGLGQEMYGSAASDHFGLSLSLSADGRRLAVGAPYHDNGGPSRNVSGQVTIFDYRPNDTPGGTWQPIATMAGTDHLDWFGWKVDLEDTGQFLCVGAPRNLAFGGYVQCYDLATNKVMGGVIRNSIAPIRYDDNFGHSIRVASAGNSIRLAIGAPGKNNRALDAGMAVVYEYDVPGDKWSMLGEPIVADSPGPKDELGFAIDLQDNILVIGSPGRGQVDRYVLQSGDGPSALWQRHPDSLTGTPTSSFGYAVNQRGDRLAVGSAETAGENTGMVNVFQR
jgi:hypothetical protein